MQNIKIILFQDLLSLDCDCDLMGQCLAGTMPRKSREIIRCGESGLS